MDSFAHGAIRFRHLGDLGERVGFPSTFDAREPRRAAVFSSWAGF